ncbi:unnamed protein product [Bathycoccus prasinos]
MNGKWNDYSFCSVTHDEGLLNSADGPKKRTKQRSSGLSRAYNLLHNLCVLAQEKLSFSVASESQRARLE